MKVKQDDQTNSKSHKLGRSVVRSLAVLLERMRSQSQTKVSYVETKLPAAVDKWVCVYLVAVSNGKLRA